MENIRFVTAPLVARFEEAEHNKEAFKKEYASLSEFEEDPVGQWLKIAKARGETKESDQVLLTLLVELHKKIDRLTAIVKNEEKPLLPLAHEAAIDKIGFEHIHFEKALLHPGTIYYCRIEMPVFPKREMPLFFEAIGEDIGKIVLIHHKDEQDWNAYVTARERVMIREMKAQK